MTDNVQPIHGAQAPSLPDVDPSPADNVTATNAGGQSSDLPETSAQNPMPAWFMGLVVLIVLIMAGGGYVGYLVLSNQLSVPGTQTTPLKAPIAPPVPQSTDASKTAVAASSQSDALQNVTGGTPQYQINIMRPTDSAQATMPVQGTPIGNNAVESGTPKAVAATVSSSEVNIEAAPLISPRVNHAATSPSSMLEFNTHEVLSEHSERLLALEGMAAEHAEVLSLMKDELQSTKRRLISTDQNIAKAIKRIDGLTGKTVKAPRTRASSSVAGDALPFKPLSYRTFGEQISVRVRAPSQKAQSLRIGQALSGWRLMSADPVARTAVFLNVSSFKKHEVAL
ncbi:MAG: hypothetical protein CL693_02985 [Cellvibrionaceae bacterium]|nr:hypothetical protein [Cellvibrionaceae bacterium]|tara:strand:+ start:6881 stop:7897 length:1017 start_codon:yes stop_codon:yes gene_type:complete